MDAGLLLAGVSAVVKPPGAPPGKEIETPPAEARNDFKDVLKQAEGKSSGEVTESEPNAQPEKLDSTEDKPKRSDWVALLGPPVLPPVLLAVSSELAKLTAPTAVVTAPQELKIEFAATLPELTSVGATQPLADPVNAPVSKFGISEQAQAVINVVDVKASQIGTSVAPDAKRDIPVLAQPQQLEANAPVATPQVAEAEAQLEMPDVAAAAQVAPQAEVNATKVPVPAKPATSEPSEIQAVGLTVESEEQSEDTADTNQDSASGFSGQNGNAPAEVKVVSSKTVEQVEQSTGMTAAERKAVVHQLTRKIEALAVNSVRNEVTVRMEPAELGTVLVQVSRGVGEMTASLSASDEKLQNTLHEARNELAAALTAKTNSVVKVEVISADSTPMANSSDAHKQSGSQQQSRQEALTKFYEQKAPVMEKTAAKVTRIKIGMIDLES